MSRNLKRWVRGSTNQRRGQSLIEYSLLIAFIALACIVVVLDVGDSALGIAEEGDEALAVANGASSTETASAENGGDPGSGGSGTASTSRRHRGRRRWNH